VTVEPAFRQTVFNRKLAFFTDREGEPGTVSGD
jgi:hypothetical protein